MAWDMTLFIMVAGFLDLQDKNVSKRERSDSSLDRISSLPDNLIIRVPPFLKTRDIVKMSYCRRNWRHKWKTAPIISLSPGSLNNCHQLNSIATYIVSSRRVSREFCTLDSEKLL
ncbi:hypothetical protein SLA2020_482210 [Shorea laevis]